MPDYLDIWIARKYYLNILTFYIGQFYTQL